MRDVYCPCWHGQKKLGIKKVEPTSDDISEAMYIVFRALGDALGVNVWGNAPPGELVLRIALALARRSRKRDRVKKKKSDAENVGVGTT